MVRLKETGKELRESLKIDQLTELTGRVLQDILPWKESQNEGHH